MTPLDFPKQFSRFSDQALSLGAQFGLECELDQPEFVLEKGTPLFISPEIWSSCNLQEKKELYSQRAATVTFGEKPNLFRYRDRVDIHLDDTGNLEWTLGPKSDFSILWQEFEALIQDLGPGSFQAMVSFPRTEIFAKHSVSEILGWFHFFQEFEILERCMEGLTIFRSAGRAPLRTFLHPYLGPMVLLRHKYLKKYLIANSRGELFDEDSKKLVKVREQSFKYVGATTYRPDIAGPDRIALEIRDAHKDQRKLQRRLLRVLFYWTGSLAKFSKFEAIPAFDSESEFSSLPDDIRSWLENELQREIPDRVKDFPKAKFSHETFRNFSYPFRNWQRFLELFGISSEKDQIANAQKNYLEKIRKLKDQKLPKTENKIFLQLFVCEFVEESGLFQLFFNEEKSWTS